MHIIRCLSCDDHICIFYRFELLVSYLCENKRSISMFKTHIYDLVFTGYGERYPFLENFCLIFIPNQRFIIPIFK